MIKTLFKQKKIFLTYSISLFLLFSLILSSILFFLQYQVNQSKKHELLHIEETLIRTQNTIIANRMNKISADLLYVTDCFRIHDTGNGNYEQIEKQWLAFSNRKKIYDQIRYIDLEGNEKIRINYTANGAVLVKDADLQNKKNRAYFSDSLLLSGNQIYVSKLDLNIENNKIEQPIKPVIRISTPYYDVNGQLKGIIIINYLANDMLSQIIQASSTSSGNMMILNSDGYWIYDKYNRENEWAFMDQNKAGFSFSHQYPSEWEIIKQNDHGYYISNHGVYIYLKISTSQSFVEDNLGYSFVLGSGDSILISHLSANSKEGSLFTQSFGDMLVGIVKLNGYLYLFIFFIAMIIALLLAVSKNEQQKVKYFSEYDVMTGVYNRRAGFEKLSHLYKNASINSAISSICFIDINGLKEVNDALGHEAGDELILSVIAAIKQNIRQHDFVARLGGDEFLIIFEGLDEFQAEQIWGRILMEYAKVNETENRDYVISVSHGIESFRCDASPYIDGIVNSADEKMYHEKRHLKKDLTVLRKKEEDLP